MTGSGRPARWAQPSSRASRRFPADPQDAIVFAGAPLDRAVVERRTPEAVAGLLEDPGARVVVASTRGVLIRREGSRAELWLSAPRAFAGDKVLLGVDGAGPVFAVDGDTAVLPTGAEVAALRDVAAQLGAQDAGLAAYGSALVTWHRNHRFCARCGALTTSEDAGHRRRCGGCGADHFPRTDPVVIIRVEAEGRLLLVHQPRWPSALYSVPAGFVEPGETLEQAVRRELLEETGVSVADCRYLASQPWPFPSSLMIGFSATATGGALEPDGYEVDDARWFERSEIAAMAAGGPLAVPGEHSIARWLIDDWLAKAT